MSFWNETKLWKETRISTDVLLLASYACKHDIYFNGNCCNCRHIYQFFGIYELFFKFFVYYNIYEYWHILLPSDAFHVLWNLWRKTLVGVVQASILMFWASLVFSNFAHVGFIVIWVFPFKLTSQWLHRLLIVCEWNCLFSLTIRV